MQRKTLIAILLAGFSSVALAAGTFEEVDANADGAVSAEEAAAVEGLDFGKADANGDGSLDKAEYEAAMAG
jgi:hypothetical protein